MTMDHKTKNEIIKTLAAAGRHDLVKIVGAAGKPKTYKELVQRAVGALKRAGLKASKYQPRKGIKESGFKIARVPGFKLPALEWEDWEHTGEDRMAEAIDALRKAGIEAKENVKGSGLYALRWVGL